MPREQFVELRHQLQKTLAIKTLIAEECSKNH